MTVEELIKRLGKLPKEYVVIVSPDYCELESIGVNKVTKEVVIK